MRLRDLLDLVGAPRGRDVTVPSLQQHGAFGVTDLPAQFADDPLTLLALDLAGEALSIDHGYPCRLIAPEPAGRAADQVGLPARGPGVTAMSPW